MIFLQFFQSTEYNMKQFSRTKSYIYETVIIFSSDKGYEIYEVMSRDLRMTGIAEELRQ